MAVKYAARTATFERATTSAFTTVATIASVKNADPFGGERGLFDQSSFGDEWMDWGIGQLDGLEWTMTLAYDPADATHQLLRGDFQTPSANAFIRANHVGMDFRYKITNVPKNISWNFDRQGNVELVLTFKIVTPGVVEETIP